MLHLHDVHVVHIVHTLVADWLQVICLPNCAGAFHHMRQVRPSYLTETHHQLVFESDIKFHDTSFVLFSVPHMNRDQFN